MLVFCSSKPYYGASLFFVVLLTTQWALSTWRCKSFNLGKLLFSYLAIWLHHVLVVAPELSSCGTRAKLLRSIWDLSSQTRDQTFIPCIRRQILNHWTTREVPVETFLNDAFFLWGVINKMLPFFGNLFLPSHFQFPRSLLIFDFSLLTFCLWSQPQSSYWTSPPADDNSQWWTYKNQWADNPGEWLTKQVGECLHCFLHIGIIACNNHIVWNCLGPASSPGGN